MSFYLPIEDLAEALDKAQIRYCVLHGWQSLADNIETDIDLVVAPEHIGGFERVLQESLGGRLVQLLQYETSGFYFVVAHPGGLPRFTAVDLCTDYHRHGLLYCSGEELLRDRRRWNRLWVASPRAEYAYLLTKKICKRVVPPGQRIRLEELQRILGKDAAQLAEASVGRYWGTRIVQWIDNANWPLVEQHLGQLRRALRWRQLHTHPKKWMRNWIPETRRKYRRWRYPTGVFVAILGPDGSGKSLLIENLREGLRPAFRRSATFHLRPNLFGPPSDPRPVTDPHSQPPRSPGVSLLKLLYYVVDYLVGYLFAIRPIIVRSGLVLFDRYYHDLLVDTTRYRYGGPRRLISWMARAVPKPDLFLILDVPEDELLTRKQELPPRELRRQRFEYRALAADTFNAFLLDGTATPAQVATKAGEICLDYMASRYRERRKRWLPKLPSEELGWISSVLFHSVNGHHEQVSADAGYRDRGTDNYFAWLKVTGGRSYLIPREPRARTISALQLHSAQTWKARLANRVLRTKPGWFLARCAAPKAKLIHPFGADTGDAELSFLAHLTKVFSRDDLDMAIALGTPGKDRKPVIQIATPTGDILGYVKVGWNQQTNALIKVEATTCIRLAGQPVTTFDVPSIISSGCWQERSFCVQSAPKGRVSPAPRSLNGDYLNALGEMSAISQRCLPLMKSLYWRALTKDSRSAQPDYKRDLLRDLVCAVEQLFAGQTIPFHLSHGDFAPWNARVVENRLYLFDWEHAEWSAPPGRDFFHFSIQVQRLLEHRTPVQVHAALNEGLPRRLFERHLKDLHIVPELALPLRLAYLAERLSAVSSDDTASVATTHFIMTLVNLGLADAHRAL